MAALYDFQSIFISSRIFDPHEWPCLVGKTGIMTFLSQMRKLSPQERIKTMTNIHWGLTRGQVLFWILSSTNSFSPQKNSTRQVVLLSLFYRWRSEQQRPGKWHRAPELWKSRAVMGNEGNLAIVSGSQTPYYSPPPSPPSSGTKIHRQCQKLNLDL